MKYIFIILLFLSCNKMQQEQHMGGALPDLPNNVPVLVSKGFISAKGRPSTTISFLSPTTGSSVSGVVTVSLSTKGKVVSSYILINGVKVASGLTYQWNTTGLPSGLYTITGIVSDGVNTASATITVTINTIIVEPSQSPTEVSLTVPPIGNQGSEGSCVAFAVGYAARSVDWYYRTGEMVTFSPEHLYNQIKFSSDCNSGTAMQTALDFLLSKGIVTLASMPYTSGSCSLFPTAAQEAEALNYRIAGYSKLYTTDRAMMKAMIDVKKAIIYNIIADNSFIAAKAGFIWNTYSGSGSLPHCIVIVGYDDNRNAWKIMNSWGTGWGDSGFGWIDYDFIVTRTGTYCYVIN